METSTWRNKAKQNAGFTLIEVIVIVAILAILAGILAPMIFRQIDDAKLARAEADGKTISSAIFVLRKDTGQWPNLDTDCLPNVTLMRGQGNMPNGASVENLFNSTVINDFNSFLSANPNNCWPLTNKIGWKGPYIPSVTPDPWGNAYIINADQFAVDNGAVWVYSAGPNGIIESEGGAMTTSGDDIGIRVK